VFSACRWAPLADSGQKNDNRFHSPRLGFPSSDQYHLAIIDGLQEKTT
jgi:hypothetical protein